MASGHVRKSGSSWRAMYSLTLNGKRTQPSKCFPTKSEAQRWLNAELSRRDRSKRLRDPLKVTFEEWFEEWLRIREAEGAAASTLVAARSTMANYGAALGPIQLSAVTTTDINDVLIAMQSLTSRRGKPLAPATIQRFKSTLHAVFEVAVRSGTFVGANPVSGALRVKQRRRKPKAWTIEEIDSFLRWLSAAGVDRGGRKTGGPHHLLPMIATFVLSGMRWGELLDLEWSNVDLDEGWIEIESSYSAHEGSKDTKSAAGERKVPIAPRLHPLLVAHRRSAAEVRLRLGATAPQHDLVFVSPSLERLSYWSGTQALTRLIKRARADGLELSFITIKDLRSTFATQAGGAGATARDIAELLGHADNGVTAMKNYVVSSLDRQREVLTNVDNLTRDRRPG